MFKHPAGPLIIPVPVAEGYTRNSGTDRLSVAVNHHCALSVSMRCILARSLAGARRAAGGVAGAPQQPSSRVGRADPPEVWIAASAGLSIRTGLATHMSRFWPARGKHGRDFDIGQMLADRASAWSAAW